ncbi:MAG: methylmalonyl Co-A mutase-associated GTPase MeaB [Acidimicrobiales bacterium]
MTDATADLAAGVASGDRRALARAITLVESQRSDHRSEGSRLLQALLPRTGNARRIGFSGAPGTGKSTLIEALGLLAVEGGHRLAVLAIDPSSALTGGSILGDKTRMAVLSTHPSAFVRPTPSRGVLGGVARNTREAILLCEAAGYDIVFVETVGVGQSEVAVADLVDLFVLVASPSGGDELQGIKRGIMELADLIVVNKADGDLAPAATRACSDLRQAVHLLRPKRPGWSSEVRTCSALEGTGIDDVWAAIVELHDRLRSSVVLEDLRAEQSWSWMWREVSDSLMDELRSDPAVIDALDGLHERLRKGQVTPSAAARHLLDAHARVGSAEGDVAGGQ